MRRKTFLILAFTLWTASAAAAEATIQSCSDGDTCAVQVAGLAFKVRLIGIDAPETGRKKGGGQPFAWEAKQTLNGMVAGKKLEVVQYGLDGYNRPLVTIRTEKGVVVNEELVAQGLAEVYEGTRKYDLVRLKDLQGRAKSAQKGIWSLGSHYVSPYLYRKRKRLAAE